MSHDNDSEEKKRLPIRRITMALDKGKSSQDVAQLWFRRKEKAPNTSPNYGTEEKKRLPIRRAKPTNLSRVYIARGT